jgi:predicted component of type VI protein secretion system
MAERKKISILLDYDDIINEAINKKSAKQTKTEFYKTREEIEYDIKKRLENDFEYQKLEKQINEIQQLFSIQDMYNSIYKKFENNETYKKLEKFLNDLIKQKLKIYEEVYKQEFERVGEELINHLANKYL